MLNQHHTTDVCYMNRVWKCKHKDCLTELPSLYKVFHNIGGWHVYPKSFPVEMFYHQETQCIVKSIPKQ